MYASDEYFSCHIHSCAVEPAKCSLNDTHGREIHVHVHVYTVAVKIVVTRLQGVQRPYHLVVPFLSQEVAGKLITIFISCFGTSYAHYVLVKACHSLGV